MLDIHTLLDRFYQKIYKINPEIQQNQIIFNFNENNNNSL